jgi:metal transporter CNNM
MTFLIWTGIFLCLSQSAMFSGLNLGLFSLTRLELQVAAQSGDERAVKILSLRRDANLCLVTILWGNVGVNVLLALLSGSVLTGIMAFLFSTVAITLFAEILPQSYCSRHALRIASVFVPVLKLYQVLLYPVAKPTAMALDWWLGGEEIKYYKEKDIRTILRLHMHSETSDIARIEGQGALNFLDIDDIPITEEGEPVTEGSIVPLRFEQGRPVFPPIDADINNAFLQKINHPCVRWIILVDERNEPVLVLHSDAFIRAALFSPETFKPLRHCHRPIIIRDDKAKLGTLFQRFVVRSDDLEEDIIENDVILLWNNNPRLITGRDILGRLLRGISRTPSGKRTPGEEPLPIT